MTILAPEFFPYNLEGFMCNVTHVKSVKFRRYQLENILEISKYGYHIL